MPGSTGIEVDFDVRALAHNRRVLGRWSKRTDREIERVLNRTAVRTHRRIVRNITNWPAVDTGDYRNTVTVEKRPNARTVGPTADYAEHVEFGTSKMDARPSTLPAWIEERPVFLRELGNALKL